ncbi:MAG: hypothetical protein KJ638_04230, partial [Chloroflexi bacterium]|nr:hypothetical protein [Chloroflexota bacterium]
MNSPPQLSPINVPSLLRRFGLRPNKRLGQNFLVDETALRRVVDAAGIAGCEVILEVGPGLGSLTRHLAAASRQVIAVELDKELIPPLREVLAPFDNVMIVHGDILQLDPSELLSRVEPGAGSDERVAGSANLQSPIPNSQFPISNPQSPISNPQSPISIPQSPIPNLQSPISNPQSPISNPQSPIS